MAHRTTAEIEQALPEIRRSPTTDGRLALIVCRPAVDERELLDEGELSLEHGLVGDTWQDRPSRRSPDGGPHPDMQLNVINARISHFLAHDDEARAALAGDQLHVDLDLSGENLPPGTRLHIGDAAVIEITDQPHTGCHKFSGRFGPEALRFVNSPVGRELNLRGVNAKVVAPGPIRRDDPIRVER